MCEYPDVYNEVIRRARKEHKCCECRGVIQKREFYQYVSGIWNGEADSYKTCIDCVKMRKLIGSNYCDMNEIAFECLSDELGEFRNDLHDDFKFQIENYVRKLSLRGVDKSWLLDIEE
jgi:hypothetical protein